MNDLMQVIDTSIAEAERQPLQERAFTFLGELEAQGYTISRSTEGGPGNGE